MTPDARSSALLAALRTALSTRDRRAINDHVAALLAAQADIGDQWRSLASLMAFNGELTLGRAAFDALVTAHDASPAILFDKAAYLARIGDPDAADAILSRLPATIPSRFTHAHFRGVLAMERGDAAAMRAHFDIALGENPTSGPTWLSLAMSTDLSHDAMGDRLLALSLRTTRLGPDDGAQLCFAKAKVMIDRGDHSSAFATVAQGAALVRPRRPFDRSTDREGARRVIDGFPGKAPERTAARGAAGTARPIFVTGLPRSGTTLVEQILVSHADVSGGAELNRFQLVSADMGGLTAADFEAYERSGKAADVLASSYLHLLDERFGPSGRIVDKTLDQGRSIGLIDHLLPDAPIIWVTRDPLDRAWSCFRTYFAEGLGWTFDLADIADHCQVEDALLSFWKHRLGEKILVVSYEELVERSEPVIRRILTHCALPYDPATLEPHKTQRSIATSSVVQVRKPINRDAIGIAAPLRACLKPFTDRYFAAA